MKRLLLASVGLVALAGAIPASAADLKAPRPAAAPAAIAPIYNWTGFYIGGHIGWGHTDKDWRHADPLLDPFFVDRHSQADGFLGGGQIGFNWQTGALVLGVEGQFSWTDWDKREHCFTQGAFLLHCGHNVDWVATVAARLGFAAANWLFYVKGGFAFVDEDFHVHHPASLTTVKVSGDHDVGWMVGVGIEYGFTPNWSAKVEYNFMDFGDNTVHFFDPTGISGIDDRIKIDQQVHVVKFGINYRFGVAPAPVPVTARY
jgi:outer membrane immunogenic protein